MPRFPLRTRAFAALALALVLPACTDDTSTLAPDPADDAPVPVTDPTRGAPAFQEACAGCHTARDAFDLALFGFADSTILRRATAHVDTATALDIIAHVRTLSVAPVDPDLPLFQPTGHPAADDLTFALELFGSDAWPAGWGEAEVLALDPQEIALAVDFPTWSVEGGNTDWMPSRPLPPELMDAEGGLVRARLGAYAAVPSEQNLVAALFALRRVIHDPATPGAPCAQENDGPLADPGLCFEASRWSASLAGQHLLRDGLSYDGEVAGMTAAQDAFWEVGQAARRGLLRNQTPVDDAEVNWVSWMMLGWVFAPENRASVYHITGLNRVGLPRHGTVVTVRSLVARREASPQPYTDLRVLAQHGHGPWLVASVDTALDILEAREARGAVPVDPELRAEATEELQRTAFQLVRRLGAGGATPLVERLQQLELWGT